MERKLKFLTLAFDKETRLLCLKGNNRFVKGEITISYFYLYSVLVFINRIFRIKK